MASAQANLLPHLGHRRLGDPPEPLRAGSEDVVNAARVGHQLAIPLARAGVPGDDAVGQDALGVDAAGPRRSLAVPELFEVLPEEALELTHVADLGSAGVGPED